MASRRSYAPPLPLAPQEETAVLTQLAGIGVALLHELPPHPPSLLSVHRSHLSLFAL
jgi:hypothetical protein